MAIAWILIQGRRNSDNFDALKSIIITMWPQNGEARLAGRTHDSIADIFEEVPLLCPDTKRKTFVVSGGYLFCRYDLCSVMVDNISMVTPSQRVTCS
jgi:hypothetical protein